MTRSLDEVYAALYRERNGDLDALEAERYAPEPAPLPARPRPAGHQPVSQLEARRNLQTLTEALDGIPYESELGRGAA